MPEVDYKAILKKYMGLVQAEEGTTFIPDTAEDAEKFWGLSLYEWDALLKTREELDDAL